MEYPAIVKSKNQVFETIIINDGDQLFLNIKNMEFSGPDFDQLSLAASANKPNSEIVLDKNGFLADALIECEIPVLLAIHNLNHQAVLKVHLELGSPLPTGGIDKEELRLELISEQYSIQSQTRGFFEDALLDIKGALPEHVYIKNCFNCAFSDYSPYGNGLFGQLACFRNTKEAYRNVQSKEQLFELWDSMAGFVQETHVCGEFDRRVKGSGYRG